MDKLQMTGSTAQLVNGICLLTVFFGCRLIWGNYASFMVGIDIYNGWTKPPAHIVEQGKQIPSWLVYAYLGKLSSLSFLFPPLMPDEFVVKLRIKLFQIGC